MRGPYDRHRQVPALSVRPAEIDADCYNKVRRALARRTEADPIWLDLPGLRNLRLVLMPEAWVVADQALGHMPVIAWMGFAPAPDRALHDEVPCELHFYQGRAERILESVRAVMRRQLRAHLGDGAGRGEVVALHRGS